MTALVPCYNGELYLKRAIASIRAQTRPVDEILVVDDCSTDQSASIAREAGATVITLPTNAGPSRARNVGLERARGELVAFLDADDWWTPDHCARVVPLIDEQPHVVLAFGRSALIQFPDVLSSAALPAQRAVDALPALMRTNPVTQSAAVLRRDVALAVGGYDAAMRHSEDYDLWFRMALTGPFACVHDITCWRETHSGQASRDALSMRRAAWAARTRALDVVRRSGDTTRADVATRAALAGWRYELRDGWRSEFPAKLDAALAMHAEFELPALPYWAGLAARRVLWRPRQRARDLWRRLRGKQLPDASLIS